MKKRLSGVFDNSDLVLRGIEHLYRVMGMVLESDLMQCAVELQDAVDRQRIALLGVKDDEAVLNRSHLTEPQRPRPECRSKATVAYPNAPGALKGGPAAGKATKDPVVRVDGRCLSCSGQAPLVLAAFKMACLQYTPSPVAHDGGQHDRRDLLGRRHRLLESAHAALQEGPAAATAASDPAGDAAGEDGAGALAEYAALEGRPPRGQVVPLPTLHAGALTAR